MQRAKDKEACGCDEVHGTQIDYDDAKGEVIVLDEDEDLHADSISGRPGQAADKLVHKPSKRIKADGPNASEKTDAPNTAAVEAGPSHTAALKGETKLKKCNFDVIDLTEFDSEEDSPGPSQKRSESILPQTWTCKACTFINDSSGLRCEMCTSERTN